MAKNFEHIIHKKSNQIVNGAPKLPTASQVEYGEIAINYAEDNERISIKNSNNEIVTFSPDSVISQMLDAKADAADLEDYYTKDEAEEDMLTKQDALISGTNIKTVNNESLLGSGNVSITSSTITFRQW